MQQRLIITKTDDIRQLAHEIKFFSMRKRMFKIQLAEVGETDNHSIEKQVVRLYAMSQHPIMNTLPLFNILAYLFLVSFNVVPYAQVGIVATIALYAPFSVLVTVIARVLTIWYARKSMLRLADHLDHHPHYSFV
ncbi:MAG: hypothetical protein GXC72_04965 [Chitinophagaceae bacterium]|jgi:hypothetical protein|nr:hypothetical protein [Chitinophagaceae bacterium]